MVSEFESDEDEDCEEIDTPTDSKSLLESKHPAEFEAKLAECASGNFTEKSGITDSECHEDSGRDEEVAVISKTSSRVDEEKRIRAY